jgi:signal transduction histidine kinase
MALVGIGVLVALIAPMGIFLAIRTGERFVIAWNTAFLAYAVVGFLILWNRPGNGIGRLFLLLGLTVPLAEIAAAYAHYRLPGGEWAAWLSSMSNPIVFGSLFIFLPLLFPTGSYPSPRWRGFGVFAIVLLGLSTLLYVLTPGPLDCCARITNPIDIPAFRGLRAVTPFVFPAVVLTALVAFVSLALRYRRSRGEERLQMKWFVFAVGFILLAGVGGSLASIGLVFEDSNDLIPILVFPTAVAGIAVAVGIAVLRYRLYDIDVVVNRTLVYGALAAFITTVYVGIVVGIGALVGSRGEPNLGLQIAATALVALFFQPVRDRVQHLANRLVYGARATPYEVMAGFGDRMAGSLRVEDVLPGMAEAAARGVGAPAARVTLVLPGGGTREQVWPSDASATEFEHVAPVSHGGEPVGEIAVAKAPGDPVRPAEEALLRDLASQAGLALHNVQLTLELQARLEEISRQAEELRASQQRIVTAADDERRLLERTIEDRVERRLDDMAARLAGARETLGASPEATAGRLDELRAEAQETLEVLRDIARGIYPPLLADRGLAAAVEARAGRAATPVAVEVDGVGRYPQDVEAGMYFVCVEGIRASAEGARVRLWPEDGALRFELHGSAPEPEGLQRIRDRIEALGGEVDASGGTIAGRVPVRALEPV